MFELALISVSVLVHNSPLAVGLIVFYFTYVLVALSVYNCPHILIIRLAMQLRI